MNAAKPKILVVDDTLANLRLLIDILEPRGYEILAASSGHAALKIAAAGRPDLILLDVMMPGQNGFELCRALRNDEASQAVPIIFVTAKTEKENIVHGFRVGAVDYITKPFQDEEVLSRVATHLRIGQLLRELQEKNEKLQSEMVRREQAERARARTDERLSTLAAHEMRRWDMSGFIGTSKAVRKILDEIQRLHQFPQTSVLITGESGTGKELIARAIHYGSARSNEPFIPVNCVAIPGELAESMLFGHMRGAFTGATMDRKGCFEQADGGTLFLDEIGDMPAILQAKLLRVLEDGCVLPVGASEPKRVDVRIVAATNADLQDKIGRGAFRQDLFFRLARYRVELPPLRERREDIPVLAAHFLMSLSREMGLHVPALTERASAALAAHSFPGNVRELRNIIERALIESGGEPIQPADLHLPPGMATAMLAAAGEEDLANAPAELPFNIKAAEDVLIQRALAQTQGNIAEAARLLGIHRTRIYRKMAKD
jgi:DNA-binding NtrC family response regulator